MALTAEDINNASFSIERKGYDVDEVDVFLEHVAVEVEAMNALIADLQDKLAQARESAGSNQTTALPVQGAAGEGNVQSNEEVEALRKRVKELEDKLSEKESNDIAIAQALIVAQRSADDIVAKAQSDASNIVKDADEEADRIIGKAESDRLKIADSIKALEADRNDVRAGYREMLANFMADAQRKLAEIDGDSRRSNAVAQARAEANEKNYAPIFSKPSPHLGTGFFGKQKQKQNNVQNQSGYVEKDFSGYGDASDDFSFDVD